MDDTKIMIGVDVDPWRCQVDGCGACAAPNVFLANPEDNRRDNSVKRVEAPTKNKPYAYGTLDLNAHIIVRPPYDWGLLNGLPICDFHKRQYDRVLYTFLNGTRSQDEATIMQHHTVIETGMPRERK